ncbi:hypothetical protein J2S09_000607 [Bacillus fengqiuensis]|nr:hypothetical protein [Bacillus fengqiuensis]
MIWFTFLLLFLTVIRPYFESVAIPRLGTGPKRLRFYKEQIAFYVFIFLLFGAVIVLYEIPLSFFGWNGAFLETVNESTYFPKVISYLLLLGYVLYLLLCFAIQWMKDSGEKVFDENELPRSIEVTLPKTKKEYSWWLVYSVLSALAEAVVYMPFFIYYVQQLLRVDNPYLMILCTALLYMMSHLAFQKDRLSIQTLLVGAFLAALYMMTNSIVPLLLFYGVSFMISDLYQESQRPSDI